MQILNTYEAKAQLSKLIEAALRGEEVVISKAGKPMVRLIPYTVVKKPRKPGVWEGKITMAEDFKELPESLLKSFYRDSK